VKRLLCRASVHFFHRLSILERATNHKCNNNCNRPKEIWVGFKCNGLVILSQRRGGSKSHNTCVPPPPPPSPPLLGSPLPAPHPPPAPSLLGELSYGSGALAGVFSQEKGNPTVMTERLSYLMDQSRGRILLECRSQEMTSGDPAPLPLLPWCPLFRDMETRGGGRGGKAWPARGPTYAQLVLESWSIHKTSWM
jgi:hypothetical protein